MYPEFPPPKDRVISLKRKTFANHKSARMLHPDPDPNLTVPIDRPKEEIEGVLPPYKTFYTSGNKV